MNDRSDGRRLNAAAALLALAAAAFLYGGFFSALAPCGSWDNVLFGAPMWNEADPGGYYLASAHELYAFHGRLLYPGHPGLPLQILLRALQSVFYALAAPRGLGFTAFIAKNIAQVFFLSKMLITGLHVMTFLLLYPFALRLLARPRAALLAVLGYATSLPVVYYLSRVSVEPLMILSFLASFLCVWRSLDERGRPRRAALWAALAGGASVAGLATKFHMLWPLPAACLGHLLWGDGLPWKGARGRAPRAALLSFAAAALTALALSALVLDWRDFFASWGVGGMEGGTLASALAGLAARQAGVLVALVRGVALMPARAWVPGETRSGAFLFCELPMLAVAGLGAARLIRREGARGPWLWLGASASYTVLIWAYRCFGVSGDFHGFHYLFVFVVLAAVFFGEASDALLARRRWSPRAEAGAIALWIGAVHLAALTGAWNSRLRDAAYFGRVRAFSEALASSRDGERVALVGATPATAASITGLAVVRETPPTRSALIDALAADYVAVDRATLARLSLSPAPGERRAGSVVAVGIVDGTPAARGPFEPARWLAEPRR
jgi:hypothetical protein